MEYFFNLAQAFLAEMENGPAWVFVWVNFMGLMNILAVPVAFRRIEGVVAILAMLFVFPAMMLLYDHFGYQRILGLAHVIFWTPLLLWLWSRRDRWRVRDTLSGKWVLLFSLTIFVSLLMDYADVVRYLLGERI